MPEDFSGSSSESSVARPQAGDAPEAMPTPHPAASAEAAPESGEALDERLDEVIPGPQEDGVPVVALGGSAGSLGALQTFFQATPADSGLAFVVVVHLAPEHESALAEILQRATPMPVRQVREAVRVEPNCVYVIPSAKELSLAHGRLRLSEPWPERAKRGTVDLFFRALADAQGLRASAIVLSGANGDGAIGLKRVKERGGLTIAQEPGEAEHDGMPRAAIATGMVDWVLPAAEMPERLLGFYRQAERLRLPSEASPAEGSDAEAALREVLAFLRVRTGHDFNAYKRATVLRRLARRLQVNGLADLPSYVQFLRTHPGEAGALLQDLLISVTNFFRDPAAFQALDAEVPRFFHEKKGGDHVRVWVAGCATGEEAYSIAMLLAEHAAAQTSPPSIQVFATDLDEASLRAARAGLYPDTIAADVSEERLRRFFTPSPDGYRVNRALRETVLFAVHDVLRDSPFSHLDLVSCRNLLIYLNREAQGRALSLFHFALRPKGVLFLGSAESVDEASALFAARDKKHRLYARQAVERPVLPPPLPGAPTRPGALEPRLHPSLVKGRRPVPTALTPASPEPGGLDEPSPFMWEALHFRAVERFAPASLLIDSEHRIVHLSARADRYLQFSRGQPSLELLRVVHPMLRLELRTALFRAVQTGKPAEVGGVPVELDGALRRVTLRVQPAERLVPGLLLVIFEEQMVTELEQLEAAPAPPAEPVSRHLEAELEQLKAQQRATVEEYEASLEELKSSNEELQAINEELGTVNQELKARVEEVARANNDLQNLMAATDIATIFLDHQLRIQRYTPAAVKLFSLIQTDVGRPLADQRHRLDYASLDADAAQALEQLAPLEREVASAGSRWYLARLLPYRNAEDHVAGVVLTFVDITERKAAEEALRASEARLRLIVEGARDHAIFTVDIQGLVTSWNSGAEAILGYASAEIVGHSGDVIFTPEDRAGGTPQNERETARRAGHAEDERWYLRKDGSRFWGSGTMAPLPNGGRAPGFLKILRDLTAMHQAQLARRQAEERFRLLVHSVQDYAIILLNPGGRVTHWNEGAARLKGYAESEVLGRHVSMFYPPEQVAAGRPQRQLQEAAAHGRSHEEDWRVRKGGERFWGDELIVSLRDEETGTLLGFAKICRDLTERKAAEDERARLLAAEQAARKEAEEANRAKDRFLAALSHELRTPLTPIQLTLFALEQDAQFSAAARDALALIGRNVEVEAQLIDDLLDVSRVVHGKLELRPVPLDLHACVREGLEICRGDLAAKGLQVTVNLEASRPRLTGDPARLRQVFWNLLQNAAKFTPEGGAVTVRSRDLAGGGVAVEVADTGAGISPELLPRIFDAFERGASNVPLALGGLGLGLAIAQAIVQAHGGRLLAASAGEGQGATFTVELPAPA